MLDLRVRRDLKVSKEFKGSKEHKERLELELHSRGLLRMLGHSQHSLNRLVMRIW